MKGVVLVKLPNKSDASSLHHHVYEWEDHSVRFSKVDKMVMVHVDISPVGQWQEIVCRV